MKDNFFKYIIIVLGICIVLLLFGIYQKMDNNRFQVSASINGAVIIDTRTGDIHTPKEEK
jgi:hypothetical protein